jgi:glycosyltransferase involved in cell wall biosynthesis
LFILPSETESFGLAALEAMAMGVPVISSNTGGIPEVNIHGETGFLSNVGDVEDMAKNAIHILHDDAILLSFKNAALERSRLFDLEKILPMYEAVYNEVLNK